MMSFLKEKAKRQLSVISLVTVLFLFVATLGIPLSQHLCGGKVVSQNIYGTPRICSMGFTHIPPDQVSLGTVPCCDSRSELQAADGLENDGPSISSVRILSSIEPIIFSESILWKPSNQVEFVFRGNLSPPLIRKDLVLEYRVLLI